MSKAALKRLSGVAIDYDVRPHELVDAIVVLTDWESFAPMLARSIREAREKAHESSPSLGPSLSPSLAGVSQLPESLPSVSRVPVESSPSRRESAKSSKKARADAGGVVVGSAESPEAR